MLVESILDLKATLNTSVPTTAFTNRIAPVVDVAHAPPVLSSAENFILKMKKGVEAVDLLKRSYAQIRNAEKDSECEDDVVVSTLREQYNMVRREFDRSFGMDK